VTQGPLADHRLLEDAAATKIGEKGLAGDLGRELPILGHRGLENPALRGDVRHLEGPYWASMQRAIAASWRSIAAISRPASGTDTSATSDGTTIRLLNRRARIVDSRAWRASSRVWVSLSSTRAAWTARTASS
jgi:hypothetical protein